MRNQSRSLLFYLLLFSNLLAIDLAAANQPVATLPAFELADPTGAKHTQAEILQKGAVVFVTIPNVKHAPIQDRWARMITSGGWKKDGPKLVFIEDLSQSAVKEKSLENLKRRFAPGKNPLILIDESGAVRAKFGIMDDETVILIYDKKGKLVHFVEGAPDEDLAKKVVEAANKL